MHPANGLVSYSSRRKAKATREERFHFGGNDRKERSNDIWNKDRND